jgi:hypothetical protein
MERLSWTRLVSFLLPLAYTVPVSRSFTTGLNFIFQLYNAIFTAHFFLRGRQSTSSFLLLHLTNGHPQFMEWYEHGIFFFLNTGHGTTNTAGFGSRAGSGVYVPISAFGSPLLRYY